MIQFESVQLYSKFDNLGLNNQGMNLFAGAGAAVV
jgi:hypothetical protein